MIEALISSWCNQNGWYYYKPIKDTDQIIGHVEKFSNNFLESIWPQNAKIDIRLFTKCTINPAHRIFYLYSLKAQ